MVGPVGDYFDAPDELPDFDALLDQLREEAQGDAYSLHAALSEMLATFDADTKCIFIAEIIDRDDPFLGRLGCYWLLDKAHGFTPDQWPDREFTTDLNEGVKSIE